MIVNISADTSSIERNVQKATETLDDLSTHATGTIASGVAIGETFVQAGEKLLGFVESAVEGAGRIEDLSRATGISIEGVQRLSYAVQGFGIDAETMARGVEQLSTKLAGGDKNATTAVGMLGLSVKDLIAAGPEEAFLRIADAAGRVDDPMMKNALAADLFGGRLAKQLIPALGDLRQAIDDVPKAAVISEENVQRAHDFDTAISHAITTAKAFTVNSLGALVDALGKAQGDGWEPTAKDIDLVSAKTEGAANSTIHLTETVQEHLEKMRLAAEAAKKFAEAQTVVESAGDGWRGTLETINDDTVEAIRYYLDAGVAENTLATYYGLTAVQIKAVAEALKDEAASWTFLQHAQEIVMAETNAFLRQGATGQPDFVKQFQAMQAIARQNSGALELSGSNPFAKLGDLESVPGLGIRSMTDQLSTGLTKGFGDLFAKDLPQTMLAAVTGGGNPTVAVGTLLGGKLGANVVEHFGATITDTLGKTMGGAFSAILPGVGSLIGPLVGKIASFLANIGGPSKEELSARSSQDTMIASLKALATQGEITEGALRDNYHTIAIVARDAYMKTGESADQAAVHVKALLNTHDPTAFAAAMGDLNNVLAGQKQDAADLDAAIKKYGFSISELGPTMRAQQLAQQAAGLENDFRVLIGSGMDMNTVLQHMGGSIDDFIHLAQKTGSEVPAEMRPMLEAMVKNHELIDENGKAYDSLSDAGLTFSETMTQGFDRVVTELDKVLAGLGLIPNALSAIPDRTIHINYAVDAPPESDVIPMASGGVGTVTTPTLFLAGEAGPEDYAFSGGGRRFGAGGSEGNGDLLHQLRLMNTQLMLLPGTIARSQRDAALFANA